VTSDLAAGDRESVQGRGTEMSAARATSLAGRGVTLVVVLAYLVWIVAYLFPQDLREGARWYAGAVWCVMVVRTFRFQIGLVLLVAVGVGIHRRRWRTVLGALPLLAFGLGPAAVSLIPRGETVPRDQVLRVMSSNVMSSNRDTTDILGEVLAADPDLVVLVEYSPRWHAAAQKALSARYPHQAIAVRRDPMGVAIYSKLPFVRPVETYVPLGIVDHPQVRAVVRFGGVDITVYGVHLLPPRGRAFITEARTQFADLMEHVSHETGPTIVLGDFNSTGDGVQGSMLRAAGFKEAQHEAGWWRGSTWCVAGWMRYLPGIRIDQVYANDGLRFVRSVTGVGRGSDHRPVMADLVVDEGRR